MRRVCVIFILRKMTAPLSIKIFTLFFLFIAGNFLVSVKDVLRNAPSWRQAGALYDFYVSAFLHTEVAVQILLFGISVLFIMLFKDILMNSKKSNMPKTIASLFG